VNLPSILSTIASSPQFDLNQIDNSQQSNSGMTFDQQLTAQTEKLNQQASTIQTSESKGTESNETQSQDAKLISKTANDSEEKKVDNSEIVEAMVGMAVAPSLISGINLAAKVIDRLSSSDSETQVNGVTSVSEARSIEKNLSIDSLNTAIAKNSILGSTGVDSVINKEVMPKSNTQESALSLSEQKIIADAKALNSSIQNTLSQTSTTNTTGLAPEVMSSEVMSENDLRNAILQNARNNADSRTVNNNDNLLTSNLLDLENQLTELKANNSLKLNNSITAAAISQRVLASDLALDATKQDISINNIGTNLRSTEINSANLPELKAPVSSPDWGPALNQRITWMVANSLQNANITVNPPNLGPLEINIQTDQNKTNVQFIVSSSEVRQAIQDAIPSLGKMLESSGLQLGQADINSRSYSQNRENAKTETQIKNIEAISNQVESVAIQGQGLINTYV
jgi:flagellar hook-length control protein FliK